MTLLVANLKNHFPSCGLVTEILIFNVFLQFPNKVSTFKWVMNVDSLGGTAQACWDCGQYVADNAIQSALNILLSSSYVMLVAAIGLCYGVACVKMQWSTGKHLDSYFGHLLICLGSEANNTNSVSLHFLLVLSKKNVKEIYCMLSSG